MQVRIQDVDWSITLEKLTRRQVVAIAKLRDFVGNIEKLMKDAIREAFRVFGRARSADKEFYKRMVEAHNDVLDDPDTQ